MGLAGRDPVFHAQVESEVRSIREEFGSDPALGRGTGRDAGRRLPALPRGDGQAAVRRRPRRHAGAVLARPPARGRRPGEHPGPRRREVRRAGPRRGRLHGLPPHAGPGPARRTTSGPTCNTSWRRRSPATSTSASQGEIYGPFRDDEIAPYAMEHATGLEAEAERVPQVVAALRHVPHGRPCPTSTCRSTPRARPTARRAGADRDRSRCSASSTTTSSRRPTWSGSTASTRTRSTPGNPRARSCQDCHMSRGREGRAASGSTSRRSGRGSRRSRTRPTPRPRTSPRTTGWTCGSARTGYRRHNFSGLNVVPAGAVRPVRRRARACRRPTS